MRQIPRAECEISICDLIFSNLSGGLRLDSRLFLRGI